MTISQLSHPRFRCTGCGRCCTGNPETHYVETSRAEQKRIIKYLGIGAHEFRRRYIETAADDSEGIRLLDSGHCPFLQPDNRCGIYEVRPNQCQTYPFWPELVSSPQSWEQEKSRCEGLDQGPVIPETEIRARLALHDK